MRKVTHYALGVQQVKGYRKWQNDESKQLPYDILKCVSLFDHSIQKLMEVGKESQKLMPNILSAMPLR